MIAWRWKVGQACSAVAVVAEVVGRSKVERPSVRLVNRAIGVPLSTGDAAEVMELASKDRRAAAATVSGQTWAGRPVAIDGMRGVP